MLCLQLVVLFPTGHEINKCKVRVTLKFIKKKDFCCAMVPFLIIPLREPSKKLKYQNLTTVMTSKIVSNSILYNTVKCTICTDVGAHFKMKTFTNT